LAPQIGAVGDRANERLIKAGSPHEKFAECVAAIG
jgi:hypothetical protein